ncbi:MAG TPA: M56 family metallopeptidase [Candidatus Angelobacter sp.]|jgi:hypothetical protein|nr:M56 family metallopeptidase [Candidatus Angelobacter sp.]
MQEELSLHFAGAVLTFAVRLAVACIFCLVLERLLHRPQRRFLVWLFLSTGFVLYWLGVLAAIAKAVLLPQSGALSPAFHLPGLELKHIVVPAQWAGLIGNLELVGGTLYFAILIVLASRSISKHLRLNALLRLGSAPSPQMAAVLESLCRDLRVRRCDLVVLPEITSPATVYSWRPCILVPESCDQPGHVEQFADIMRHELMHVVRNDYLVAAFSDVVCMILFFHPAVWIARKKMKLERELACDLAVVEAHPDHRVDYAASLTRLVRLSMARDSSPGVDFAAPVSFLGRRIRSILVGPKELPVWQRLCSAGAGVTVLLTFAFLSPVLSLAFDVGSRPVDDPALVLHASGKPYVAEFGSAMAMPVSYNSLDPRSTALAHYAAHRALFRAPAAVNADPACAPALTLFEQGQRPARASYDLPVGGASQFLCDHPELHGEAQAH